MGELVTDYTTEEQAELRPLGSNAPLLITLTCAFLLITLFLGAIGGQGQAVAPPQDIGFGSLSGRVIASGPEKPVVGARIVLKRIHAGVANFYFDRITGGDGSFVFENLLPGRYTIEMDPRTVPSTMFAVPALAIIDVKPRAVTHADLAIQKRLQTQTAESAKPIDKKRN